MPYFSMTASFYRMDKRARKICQLLEKIPYCTVVSQVDQLNSFQLTEGQPHGGGGGGGRMKWSDKNLT